MTYPERGGLRFGIAVDASTPLIPWRLRCITDAVELAGALPVAVLEEHFSPTTRPVLGPARSAKVGSPSSGCALLGDLPKIPVELRERDGLIEITNTTLRAVRSHDLDFVLRFPCGPVPAALVDATRHGVWMLSHGADVGFDGTPPSLDDVLQRRGATVARLVRATPDGRHAETVYEGTFSVVAHSHAGTLAEVRNGMADWVARCCRVLDWEACDEPRTRVELVAGNGANVSILRLRMLEVARSVARVARGLVRHEQWHVGIVDAPIESFLDPVSTPSPRWLPRLVNESYVADPFGREVDGELVILAELFEYLPYVGRIVALTDHDDTRRRPATIIDVDGHASYPYLFEYEGEWYCIPENQVSGAVRLYRATSFPSAWTAEAELVTGRHVVDPTIIRHDGRWWLFFTDEDRAVNANLYLYHAENLAGPWEPHVANPVKSDVRSSRSGGTPFHHAGRWYRPAQECSRRYGNAISINEIEALTPKAFRERVVARIEPDPEGAFPNGLHTLSAVGARTLVDGRRDRMLPLSLLGRVAAAVYGVRPSTREASTKVRAV